MSVTVQNQLFKLVERIDPRNKLGVEFTAGTVGTTAGDKFTAQRQLDMYNDARFFLFGALRARMTKEQLTEIISGTMVVNSTFQFSSGVATKPAGYLEKVLLTDASGNPISILPQSAIPYVQSLEATTNNRFVFEVGNTFVDVNGSMSVPDASNYVLRYFGIQNFALSDVTGGTTTETFNDTWQILLIELAEAISMEMGNTDLMALITKYLTGRNP